MAYYIFVAHAWDYDDYDRLISLLKNSGLDFYDKSIPKTDPIHSQSEQRIKKEIRDRINRCSNILVPTGVYVSHRQFIQYEIDYARRKGKKIIGIRRRGKDKQSGIITQLKKDYPNIEVVNWSTNSIIAAIRGY